MVLWRRGRRSRLSVLLAAARCLVRPPQLQLLMVLYQEGVYHRAVVNIGGLAVVRRGVVGRV